VTLPISTVPPREPVTHTLLRNVVIAMVAGGALAARFGGLAAWPVLTGAALWFSLGGHVVELLFLDTVRPRYPMPHVVAALVRVAMWFTGGSILGVAAAGTLTLISHTERTGHVAAMLSVNGGLVLIGVELLAHAGLAVRQKPNVFYGHG
jgi:hypothetical protein